MRIGIKYCGGCNPMYDRLDFVNELKKYFKNESFVNVKEYEIYDFIFIICGCHSACVNYNSLISKKKIIITNMDDINKLKDYLM